MAKKLVRVLRPQHPDAHYLKKVFQHTRELLAVEPKLLTDRELVALYETLWQTRQLTHLVMLKLLLFTGLRNAELVRLRLTEVDLQSCQLRITQGKGRKDRYVLFPTSFRGELAQYIERQRERGGTYLFESNRHRPYSTRRIRQLVKQCALAAGIAKRVYPHLFRHQLITYLTKQGIIRPKLQLLSGHTTEQSLAVYRELALSDVAEEYEAAMRGFPVR
jgi:integrase/recombinase XerD